MSSTNGVPPRESVHRILAAAADVVFSDGVSDAFLDQWADETLMMLSFDAAAIELASGERAGS